MPINGHTKSHHILTVFFSLPGTRKYQEFLQGTCSQTVLKAFNTFRIWTEFRSMTKVPSPLHDPGLLLRWRTAACSHCCSPWPFRLFSVHRAPSPQPQSSEQGTIPKSPPPETSGCVLWQSSSAPVCYWGSAKCRSIYLCLMVSKSNPNSSIIVFMLWGTKHFTASRAGPKGCQRGTAV